MFHIFCIYSSADCHVGWFCVLVIMSRATVIVMDVKHHVEW